MTNYEEYVLIGALHQVIVMIDTSYLIGVKIINGGLHFIFIFSLLLDSSFLLFSIFYF